MSLKVVDGEELLSNDFITFTQNVKSREEKEEI